MEIRGKVAVVTGGGSGIGRSTAKALAAEGAQVVVADVDDAGGQATVAAIRSAGGAATYVHADVSDPAGIEGLFSAAEAIYGGIDIVHNNAGIMTGGNPNWPDVSNQKVALVIGVNVAGVIMGTREAVKYMRKRGGGAVVNTASVAGLAPMPMDPIYAATKAAVILFTKGCAMLKDTENVRVNAVLPGMVDTAIIAKTGDGQTPAKWLEPAIAVTTMLQPEDIAAQVLAFIKDDSAVGQDVVVTNQR
ncbi:MAG: SDR family NAD(P)-dependent oxidoreductase [Dehalococcoidia bacterium]